MSIQTVNQVIVILGVYCNFISEIQYHNANINYKTICHKTPAATPGECFVYISGKNTSGILADKNEIVILVVDYNEFIN